MIQGSGEELMAKLGAADDSAASVLLIAIDFFLESDAMMGYLTFVLDVDATNTLLRSLSDHITQLGLDL